VISSDLERVAQIVDCVEAIDRAEATVQRYESDLDVARVAFDAVLYCLVTIAEAVQALSLDLREDHPAVDWSDMAHLRELIDPHDEILDPQMVHATIGEPAKHLRAACRAILAESVRVGEDEP
jgi:uncharacterized protein with HEPN domain